jgi:hypothetical protein
MGSSHHADRLPSLHRFKRILAFLIQRCSTFPIHPLILVTYATLCQHFRNDLYYHLPRVLGIYSQTNAVLRDATSSKDLHSPFHVPLQRLTAGRIEREGIGT